MQIYVTKMKQSPKCIKIFKTCNLYLCFLMLGMCIAVPGPCLLNLEKLVNTDTHHIGLIYTARSIGYLVGSVLGGIILDKVKSKQAVLTICNVFISATMLGIPWSKDIGTLAGCMVVNGLSLGAVDTGGNVVCLTLWGSDSGPFFQALHFTFGLGGLISPLIAASFLGNHNSLSSTDENNATFASNFSSFTAQHFDENSNTTNENVPNIFYPFTIIGALGLIITVLFLIVCIVEPEEDTNTQAEDKQNDEKSFRFILLLMLLTFVLLFITTGIEIGYAQMLTTYAVIGPLKLTASVGSFMTSVFWAAFTISRLAAVFLTIKLSSLTLIVCDLVVASIGAVVLFFFSSYEWSLWLSSVLLGVGIASFYPAAINWLDTYINVTSKIVSVFTVGTAFGEMVIPFLISYFIEMFPQILIYTVAVSCIVSALIVFSLHTILRKRVKKIYQRL